MTMAAASLGGAVAHRSGDAAPGSMPGPEIVKPSDEAVMPQGSVSPSAHGGATPVPNERTGSVL
jgi:hypothetical protein